MNKHTTASDILRALSGRGFKIAVAGTVLAAALASLQRIFSVAGGGEAMTGGFHAQLAFDALKSDWLTLALPVLCALPYSSSYVDDIKSGFIKQYLHRTSLNNYVSGKLLACALSGGLSVFLGAVLSYALSWLVFNPMELAPAPGAAVEPMLAQFIVKAALLFFSGAFWSLVGFLVAALTMNKYMAYASPFILYYVLVILHERYFEWLYVIYPKEWLNPSEGWVLGAWGVLLMLLALSSAVAMAFAASAKRRLGNV